MQTKTQHKRTAKTAKTAKLVSADRTERDLLIANIEADVAQLVKGDDYWALDSVMDHTGFMTNSTFTSAELGAAIVALSRALGVDWLRCTAEGAAFQRARHLGAKSWGECQRAGDRARLLPRLQAVAS